MKIEPSVPRRGFTLIEMSIVLVIIGLIVGGILVGQDLIRAAAVRAQISQIEKLNSAVNTFRNKYGYLPGDMPDPYASQAGFLPRGLYAGEGDGNGLIEGVDGSSAGSNSGAFVGAGETSVFWADLATAGLIEGSFPFASASTSSGGWVPFPIKSAFPSARIGISSGNVYVYAFSVSGINFFGVSAIPNLAYSATYGAPAITVAQAYSIDKKIDDGAPQTGNVLAGFLGQNGFGWDMDWGANSLYNSGLTPYSLYGQNASATSCTDSGGQSNTPEKYSVTMATGNRLNCGLSFRMQGAAR